MNDELHVIIKVLSAKLTRNFERFGLGRMDPYATVTWISRSGNKSLIARTKTLWNAHKTPVWNHTCPAMNYTGLLGAGESVEIEVWEDNNVRPPAFCGSASILVDELLGKAAAQPQDIYGPVRDLQIVRKGKSSGTVAVQATLVRPAPGNMSRAVSASYSVVHRQTPVMPSDSVTTLDFGSLDIERVIKEIRKVELKDRKHRMKTYAKCFVGSDAVNLLLSSGCVRSRAEAIQIGRIVGTEFNVFKHITDEHEFEDDNLFYQFRPFNEIYDLGEKLGEGAFSVVKKGSHKKIGKTFAIKIVQRAKLTKEDEVALMDEVAILSDLQHDNIIRLYDTFEDAQHYFMVTELVEGGELFDRIVSKSYYNEKEARDVCKILFEALSYCHSKNIAHRDLKPENLLLVSANNDSDIKVADFGFAKKAPSDACLRTQCGTPGYVAPEILKGVPYGTKSDMWSLGVITYILLGGYPPFMDKDQKQLFRKICKGQYEFHKEYWGEVSTETKQLISSLLTLNPAKRLSAKEALQDSWIMGDDRALEGKDLGKNLQELKRFNAKRKFRASVQAIIVASRLDSLRKDISGLSFKDDE